MKYVQAKALRFQTRADVPAFSLVWSIEPEELSPIGEATLDYLTKMHSVDLLSWRCQCLHEFADLQDMPVPPGGGKFYNVNFFYFEAMAAVRESIVAGLNGLFHASFAVLRSAFEMFFFHGWWKSFAAADGDYSKFYEWFEGKATAPGIGGLFPDCYRHRPTCAPTEAQARDFYRRLCSYSHKPTFAEAVTTIRGSNDLSPTAELIEFWSNFLSEAFQLLVDLAVRTSPQALFPIDITRKFGFNPPVGIFFDHSNVVPLIVALGDDAFQRYSDHFRSLEPSLSLVEWGLAWPDLSDEQILASWSEDEPLPDNPNVSERVAVAMLQVKAKIRALAQVFAYMKDVPVLPNIAALFESAETGG